MRKVNYLLLVVVVLLAGYGCTVTKESIRLSDKESYLLGLQLIHSWRTSDGRELLEKVEINYPKSPYAPLAIKALGDNSFEHENWDEAAVNYQLFLDFHPTHKEAPDVLWNLALCRINSFSSIDRDLSKTKLAINEFSKFIEYFPKDDRVALAKLRIKQCEDRLAEHEVYVARIYYKLKEYEATVARIQYLLREYPDYEHLDEGLYYLGLAYLEQKQYAEAKATFLRITEDYLTSDYYFKSLAKLQEIGARVR